MTIYWEAQPHEDKACPNSWKEEGYWSSEEKKVMKTAKKREKEEKKGIEEAGKPWSQNAVIDGIINRVLIDPLNNEEPKTSKETTA